MASWFRRSKRSGTATADGVDSVDGVDVDDGAVTAEELTEGERSDPPTSPTRLPTAAELAAYDAGTDLDPGGTEPEAGTSEHGVEPDQVSTDRQALIQLCLYALDRARSSGVAERIEHGLADVGVRALRPDGERFDPAVHEAGATVATEDVTLDGFVAETEVVGFADRDRMLRPPIVTVYTRNGPR
ncbi:GrpE protein [Tamaricihabitans halophyticus]|uniref:GrpE protein n=1 Tax=Tamaricihabitans halophyticus TaxID=1262583 RepID=A0A4R2R451_9PSEU|nr:nucleotide exchange factor GrpE [Tamaricihabitans halophyticus]TCP57353.1 GrpE protein [Tamaricihabitans halophyticus]